MKPIISIIVPVFNVKDYLDRCVKSLVAQTFTNIEIILVDDGSTDGSSALCDKLVKTDSRIKVIHQKNGGLSDARNCGIKNASGDFIMFIDSDDYISNDSCERFVSLIDDECDIIVGEATLIKKDNVSYQKHDCLIEGKLYTNREYIIRSINHNEFYAPVCFNIYRRSFLVDNSLFFKEGIYHEDMEVLLRTYLNARCIKCLKYPFYQYVIREDSITTKKSGNSKNVSDLFDIYTEWLKTINCILDNKLKKKLKCNLSKHIIHTCRYYKVDKGLPNGINKSFLIMNTLNVKEFVKTIAFLSFRKIYINL